MEDRKATIKGVFRHDSNEQLLARYAWYVTHITSEECSTDDDFQLLKAEILKRMSNNRVSDAYKQGYIDGQRGELFGGEEE